MNSAWALQATLAMLGVLWLLFHHKEDPKRSTQPPKRPSEASRVHDHSAVSRMHGAPNSNKTLTWKKQRWEIMNRSLTDFHGDSYDWYVVPIVFPHRLCQDTDPHHGDGDHAIVLIGEEDLGQKLHHVRVLLVSKCRLKVPDVGEIHPFPKGFKIGSQSWPSFSYIFFTNNW